MNEKKTIPLPPGITQIIPKDDMRTEKDTIGNSPAKCWRDTGVVWTNNKIFPYLDEATQAFILGHEGKHITANTNDEFVADAGAFDWCMKNGIGLSKTVLALTRVLSYPDERPLQKAEQEARTTAMLRRALKYDWEVNGNEKAKEALMKNNLTNMEMESHLAGFTIGGVSRPPVMSRPVNPLIIINKPGGQSTPRVVSGVKSMVIPQGGLTAGALEQFLTQPPPRTTGGAGGGNPTGEERKATTEEEKDEEKKILGMSPTAFYITLSVTVLILAVGSYLLLRKKK